MMFYNIYLSPHISGSCSKLLNGRESADMSIPHSLSISDSGFGSELEHILKKSSKEMVGYLNIRSESDDNTHRLWDRIMENIYLDKIYELDNIDSSIRGAYFAGSDSIKIMRFQPQSAKAYVRAHERQHRINQYLGLPQDETSVDQATQYRMSYAYPDRFRTY